MTEFGATTLERSIIIIVIMHYSHIRSDNNSCNGNLRSLRCEDSRTQKAQIRYIVPVTEKMTPTDGRGYGMEMEVKRGVSCSIAIKE